MTETRQFGIPLTTEEKTARMPTGWSVPLGRVWLIEGGPRIPAGPLAELGALVAAIDSRLPPTGYAYPTNDPDMERVRDILDAIFEGEGVEFQARFGGFGLWDVRLTRGSEGSYGWDRCRQGLQQSDAGFFGRLYPQS